MEKIDYSLFIKVKFLEEQKKRDTIFKNIEEKMYEMRYDDDYIQSQIKELFNWMNKFYDCSIENFKGLAEVYEFNNNFSDIIIKNYNKDMPKYLSKAIVCFCDNL